jgi:hypothetical protein
VEQAAFTDDTTRAKNARRADAGSRGDATAISDDAERANAHVVTNHSPVSDLGGVMDARS